MALTSVYDPESHRHIVTQDFPNEAQADCFAFCICVRPGIKVLSLEQRGSGRWFVVYATTPKEPPC